MRPPADGTGQEGSILVVVLASLVLLGAVGAWVVRVSTEMVRREAQLAARERAEIMADGLARLWAGKLQRGMVAAPFQLTCAIDGLVGTISIIQVGGLVDLNAAPLSLLEGLGRMAGLDPRAAQALAASIVDFRDTDDVPMVLGAEAEDYRRANLPHGPKNAPFVSITELDQLPDMTVDLLGRLRPLVTVHSRLPGLDPRQVVPELAPLVRGGAPDDTASMGTVSALAITSTSRAFRLRAAVRAPETVGVLREATVELVTSSSGGPRLRFLDWGLVLPTTEIEPSTQSLARERPPCT